ncbi:phage specificity protein [Escherichia coli]
METTSKGDRNPSEVRLLVQIQRNGGWVTEKDITIKAKPPRSIWLGGGG